MNEVKHIAIGKIGKFKVKDVPERTGTIMMGDRKGETYTVPAHSEITFKKFELQFEYIFRVYFEKLNYSLNI